MLTIISRKPNFLLVSKEIIVALFKKLIGVTRGPEAVLASLTRGLQEAKFPFILNSIKPLLGLVHVVHDVKALMWAIAEKKSSRIKKILAGPTLVITPLDSNGILRDPAIDIILVPSDWVKDFYISVAPEIASKIRVWASGTKTTPSSDKKGNPIIFVKNEDARLIESVVSTLQKKGIAYDLLTYGSFKKADYERLLTHAPYLVVIGKSESQGLALNEAWMADVPTLVYNPKEWMATIEGKKYTWKDAKIGAPYLSPETGMFWNKDESFESTFETFQSKLASFSPRSYSLKHFTDTISAQRLVDIIHEIKN